MNPKRFYIKNILFLFILILFSQNCVEHIFQINVSPMGNFLIQYQGTGDIEDLTNSDFPVPKYHDWEIISNFVEMDESYVFSSRKEFQTNEPIPNNYFQGDSIPKEALLKHPMGITKNNYYFFNTYNFKCEFLTRDVITKYPKLADFIKNKDNPPVGWMQEMFASLFIQTLDASNIGFNRYPIIKKNIDTWINNTILSLEDSTLFSNLNTYKKEGLDILKSNIINNKNNIDSIFNFFEMEATTTLNLNDDVFSFKVILPGKLNNSNADSISINTLFWKLSVSDFLDADKLIFANSYIIYQKRLMISFTILVIMIIFFLKNRNQIL